MIDQNILKQLHGELLENELLAPYTTFQVGGTAKYLYKPVDADDLSLFLSLWPEDENIICFGKGSNLLVRDEGFDGTIVLIENTLNKIQQEQDLIYAGAGASWMTLVNESVEWGFTGLEKLAGIPGTVGGALTMNAGAYGVQTWNYVTQVEMMNRKGERFLRKPSEFTIGYRRVNSPAQEWFVAGYFKLASGNKIESMKEIKRILAKRAASQPLDLPNAGSVFRNPPNNYSAKLIQASGLQGYRIGGASVSTKHANFIVNDQGASAKDIEALINYVKETVKKDSGITLQREVRILTNEGIWIDEKTV